MHGVGQMPGLALQQNTVIKSTAHLNDEVGIARLRGIVQLRTAEARNVKPRRASTAGTGGHMGE